MDNFLNKACIIIPTQIDSDDRFFNINFIVNYYSEFNIIIKETGLEKKLNFDCSPNVKHIFEFNDNPIFHKTKVLNDLYRFCDSEILIVLDADVLIPKESLYSAINLIESGDFDAVYPYRFNNGVYMLDRHKTDELDVSNLDMNITTNINAGYGYCVLIKKNSFESIGCENEDFFGYAPEDWERHDRIKKLLRVQYLDNICYHINHQIINFHNKQPFFQENQNLYNRINTYNGEEYKCYVEKLKEKYIKQ